MGAEQKKTGSAAGPKKIFRALIFLVNQIDKKEDGRPAGEKRPTNI